MLTTDIQGQQALGTWQSACFRWGPTLALSAGLLAILVVLSIRAAGELVYSLDDPYIHLALARLIQQGSYGINPGEWASPSSSVLWPFLLALAPARWLEWAPLAINALACLLSVQVLRKVLEEAGMASWVQVLGSVALGFGLNLFGLAMTGMEHSLQVLLVLCIAWRMVAQRHDGLFYVALFLAPLVRYECLAISVPCAAWAWRSGDKVRPALSMGLLLAVLAGFSFTLHGWGLPWLPASVLAKSGDRSLVQNVKLQAASLVLLAWLGYVHWRQGQMLRFVWLMLAPMLAFLLVGRAGWFGRYEVFMAAWLVVFTLATWPRANGAAADRLQRMLTRWPVWTSALLCVALSAAFHELWIHTLFTPMASANMAQQQAVMARLARELKEPVAVNDLGLVAFRSGVRVLDLWGLASHEALQARLNGPWSGARIEQLMASQGVEIAMVYKGWFPELPRNWVQVGGLVLAVPQASAAEPEVALMARNPAAARRLQAAMVRLVTMHPQLGQLFWSDPLPEAAAP